jgi:hypothetical protein
MNSFNVKVKQTRSTALPCDLDLLDRIGVGYSDNGVIHTFTDDELLLIMKHIDHQCVDTQMSIFI